MIQKKHKSVYFGDVYRGEYRHIYMYYLIYNRVFR